MARQILAIDQGTSGLKLMLLCPDTGSKVSVSRPYATHYPAPGCIEQYAGDWWDAVCSGVPELLCKAGITPGDIAAIGVDGISWTPVLLGEGGELLGRSPIWNDTRSTAECEEICRIVGESRVFEVSGNPVQPYYTTPKLLRLRRRDTDTYKKVKTVLGSNGYLVWKLTGELTQDVSQAYGWAFYDMRRDCWDEAMAEALGIDLSLLPKLTESMAVAGVVTAKAAAETGLAAGTPVVAGGLDAACGVLGAGVIHPGPAQEQSGSAGGMSICTDSYSPAKGLIMGRHVVPGRWLLQGGTVGGGGVFRWLRQELYPDGIEAPFSPTEELNNAAAAAPAGSDGLVFLPYMAGERSPIWDPAAKGVWYGLDFSKTRGHLVRSAMEGAAYALRHNLEIAAACGEVPSELRAVGGASASSLWMQIKADITGCPIRAVVDADATAVGTAMLAGVGCGIIPDFETACKNFVALGRPYFPNPETKPVYDAGFETYKTIYSQLKSVMKGDRT